MSAFRKCLLSASAPMVILVGAWGLTGAAAAQTTSAGDADATGDEVVVTGSRIPRPDLVSDKPMTVVAGEDQNLRGYTNVSELLNNLPVAGVPESPRGAQGDNVGRNYVNLLNLGSQRTLTLVNGRRFVSSNAPSSGSINPGSQVDLNNIPSGLIDRVEVIEATGAATYGSDAIAGVANIILKQNVRGLTIDSQYGITEHGDVPRWRTTITEGVGFAQDRGDLVVSYEHSSSGGLLNSDRDWGLGYSFFPNPANTSRTDGIPATILVCCRTQTDINVGGLPLTSPSSGLNSVLRMPDPANPGQTVLAQFAPDGTLVPYNPGQLFASGSANGDGWNTAYYMNLIAPIDRDLGYVSARYKLNDNIRAFVEASVSKVRAEESSRQAGVLNYAGFGGGPQGAIQLGVDNPFLTTQARDIITGQGLSTFYMTRFNADVVPGNGRVSTTNTKRAVAGFEGEFDAGDRHFTWNAFGNVGESRGHLSWFDINSKRFDYAVDAVRAPNGDIACRVSVNNPGSTDPDIANCQPLNLFGAGAPSDAARSYVDVVEEQNSRLRQTNAEINFGGELFDLPAGKLKFAVGYDYRKESSSVTANQALLEGVGRLPPFVPLSGGYATNEVYGEILAPLVGGDFTLPMVQNLEFEGAYRVSDNSLVGRDKAWNAGLKWKPVDDLMLRGSISRTFRSPAAVELFLPSQLVSTNSLHDPCDFRYINTGNNVAARQANCQALFRSLGLPTDTQFISQVVDIGFPFPLGGNPNLKNEVANSWTLGAVLQPRWIPGLSLTVDYVHIDIRDAIVVFDGAAITRVCYDAPTPDPAVCGLISRDNQGQITNIQQGYVNAGYTKYAGWDFGATYMFSLDRLHDGWPGALTLSANARNVRRLETSVTGFDYDLNFVAGTFAAPHWTGQGSVAYRQGPVLVSWNTQYTGPAVNNLLFTHEDRDVLGAGAIWRHDISAQYDINERVSVRAGAYNIFNQSPPFGTLAIGQSGTNGGYVDVLGRSYFAGAVVRF